MIKKDILVVDDNEINREMLAEILKDKYNVLQAENGKAALDLLREKEGIALILLDVMMPVMDGYTFLDIKKEDKELSLIPVIVLTQGNSEEDEVKALAHGATDFVPKPYRPQVILHRIESIITLRESAAMVNQLRYDRLTGIYTKEYFFRKMQERLQENPDKDYCVVCSNVENFKMFNDIYGAKTSDELLKKIARAIRKTVGEDGICGRFSADRFILLQESRNVREDNTYFKDFNESVSPDMKKVVMRWGIYNIRDRKIPVEEMCDRAILAVNNIKGTYNRLFAVYDDLLRDKLMKEKAITDAMDGALAREEFVVYFQPKYSLRDNKMVGAEGLIRWKHPVYGMIPPSEFIPLFEKNGFISKLDKYVWEKTCCAINSWKSKGYSLLPISVNVSRVDMFRPDIEDIFKNLIKKYGIDPAYLELEITESVYSESLDQIISTVNNLRDIGFSIQMDDFGSGYSSLIMISRMKLDVLKLDMKFVRNETAKPAERSMLNDVVAMAHRLDLKVVAEGVETREQMRRLHSIGCDYVQGYFLAKPMPISEFEELLANQSKKPAEPRKKDKAVLPEKYSVVIADEDTRYSNKISAAFDDEYNLIQSADADSIINKIKENGEEIAAIILSMTLPSDGAARIMKYLQRESGYWHIPVLATIPSSSQMKDLPLAFEADDFLCKLHPVFDLRKKIQHLIDEAIMHKRVNSLLDEAHHDYMTGLLNRRGLSVAMDKLRKEHASVALCIFDLDNLKKVNDSYGHDVGDSLISAFTALLKDSTQSEDLLCRYGGDEFIILFKNITSEEAQNRINKICTKCKENIIAPGLTLSASCGIALSDDGDAYLPTLIDSADRALYRAKHENKGSFCVWDKINSVAE